MKRVITLALVAVATTLGFSQQVKFGAKAGVNASHFRITEVDATVVSENRIGFYLGATAEAPLSKKSDKFSAQVEALYVQNGGKIQNGGEEIRVHQLNLPVFLKYRVVGGLKINAGGYVGAIIGGDSKIGEEWTTEGFSDAFKTFDAGVLVGAEYQLPNNGVFIDVRYNWGLTDISNFEGSSAIRNKNLQVGLGYKF